MRYSRLLISTVKEIPADAEIASHRLMIRAALIRRLASGTYTYLPLGFRCLQKVISIVREEMDKAGAQEILMPAVQPIELWQKTGRDVDYGPTMAIFADRHFEPRVAAGVMQLQLTVEGGFHEEANDEAGLRPHIWSIVICASSF